MASSAASLTTALASSQALAGDSNSSCSSIKARRLTAPSIVAQVRSLALRTRDSIQHSNSNSLGVGGTGGTTAASSGGGGSGEKKSSSGNKKSHGRRANGGILGGIGSSSSGLSAATLSMLMPTPITMKLLLVMCRCHNDTFQGAIIDGNLDALKDAHEKLSAANIPVEFKELQGSDKKPRLEVHEVAVRHGGARRGSITASDGHGHHRGDRGDHHRGGGGGDHDSKGGGGDTTTTTHHHNRTIGYCPIKATDILAVLGTHGYDIVTSAGMSDGRLLYTLRKP